MKRKQTQAHKRNCKSCQFFGSLENQLHVVYYSSMIQRDETISN